MAVKEADSGLKQCFRTILQLIDLDIVELWTRGQKGLSVRYIYRGNFPNADSKRFSFNENESKKLIEKTMSRDTFYFTNSKDDTATDDKNFMSRICFHLPAQNVTTDVFIVGYSVGLTQFTGQKLSLFYWLGHSAVAVAFSSAVDPIESDVKQRQIDKTSTSEHIGPDVLQIFEGSGSTPTMSTSNNDSQNNGSERSVIIPFSKQIIAPLETTGDVKLFMENSSMSSKVTDPSTRGARYGEQSTGGEFRRMDLELMYNTSSNLRNSSESLKTKRNSGSSQSGRIDINEVMITKSRSPTLSTPVRRGSLTYQEISAIRKEANLMFSGSTPHSIERDRSNGQEQSESGYYSRGAGSVSVCSSVGLMSDNVTMGSALTSITGITRTKPNKPQRPVKIFDFNIVNLPLLRDINRRVDLNEMVALEYVTGGSHSQIYSAMWHGQSVIVKILSEQKANHSVAIHEFDVECELLARLNHPNVASILGGGIIPRPFIVMERLRDLSEILNLAAQDLNPTIFKNKSFKYIEVLHLARDLAIALKYLHGEVHQDATIIHRDIKPENLGLAADGKLKLFDFGLCRCVKARSSDTELYEMTGNTGSLRYMAPEVVLGQPYTERVDVYSFGMIMWTLARNKSPFKGFDRAMHRARVVLEGERPKMDPDWPTDFAVLLEACWHQDSDQRPPFSVICDLLDKMIDACSKDPLGVRTKAKGLSFLKSMFSKR